MEEYDWILWCWGSLTFVMDSYLYFIIHPIECQYTWCILHWFCGQPQEWSKTGRDTSLHKHHPNIFLIVLFLPFFLSLIALWLITILTLINYLKTDWRFVPWNRISLRNLYLIHIPVLALFSLVFWNLRIIKSKVSPDPFTPSFKNLLNILILLTKKNWI